MFFLRVFGDLNLCKYVNAVASDTFSSVFCAFTLKNKSLYFILMNNSYTVKKSEKINNPISS